MSEERYATLVGELMALRPGQVVAVPKAELTPRPAAWRRSLGLPHRRILVQWRDGVVHVHESRTHYYVHRDTVAAHDSPLRHIREDAPRVWRALPALGVAVVAGMAVLLRSRA